MGGAGETWVVAAYGYLYAVEHALGELVVQTVGHMARAGEHDMLEQVREPGPPPDLVLRVRRGTTR
jgi:hypothetical protein